MLKEDENLIKKAQDGDMTAFTQIVKKYDKNVLGIISNFRFNSEDAKDIYQEVFIRVFKGLKKFKFESEFSTWLYRITTNVCLTQHNKDKNNQTISFSNQVADIHDVDEEKYIATKSLAHPRNVHRDVDESDISKHTEKALYKLPTQQRLAFILKYYQDYKIKEIADLMEVAEGTIKRYLFDATIKMKQLLQYVVE